MGMMDNRENARRHPLLRKAVLAAAVILLLLVAGVVVLLSRLESFRPRVEALAAEALGTKVRIGSIGVDLLPGVAVALRDVHIKNSATDIASVGAVKVGVEILPLLEREVRVTEIALVNPRVTVTREETGKLNIAKFAKKPRKEGGGFRLPPGLERFFIKNGSITYLDRKSGERATVSGLNVAVGGISSGEGEPRGLRNISFTGRMSCDEIKSRRLEVTDLAVSMNATGGVVMLDPMTMELFGSRARGTVKAALDATPPVITVRYSVPELSSARLVSYVSDAKVMKGAMHVRADLTMRGSGLHEMLKTLTGEVSVSSQDLVMTNMDLDKLIESFEETQTFNLIDIGAVFIPGVGPLGVALSKAFDYGKFYAEAVGKGQTTIEKLLSDWTVRDGVMEAKDVAFRTKRNRVALKGKLDLVNQRYENLTVGVLNKEGCAVVSQEIRGTFGHPEVQKVSVIKSLLGPVLGLLKIPKNVIFREKCETFYTGAVEQPKVKEKGLPIPFKDKIPFP
jgi:AsmA protein